MASMAPVDLVILFDEDTPLRAIEALRPDVLVKGSDYTVDQVVGGELVRTWGGKVVLVTLREGHSTTGTIRRMSAPSEVPVTAPTPDPDRPSGPPRSPNRSKAG
jgi:D-beta-D-heptose 7-phosphate kinase/D-beta-D-heptose 1-phosphate adenosyltransferase